MRPFSVAWAFALGTVLSALPAMLVTASPILDGYATTPVYLSSVDVAGQLGPQLSSNSSIYTANDSRFANATARWQAYSPPNISIVVEVGTEEDVATTVKFANEIGVPFLAVNRGHGITTTLARFQHGIEIWLNQLDGIDIYPDTLSAFFQGGVWVEQVMEAMYEAGFVTSTGACGCVSVMGPALGGGHGHYQGHYGLIADGLISMNVVLANGSTITVSEDSCPDLWWGMRGAGHNFGIVTSFHAKVHRPVVKDWYLTTYIYTEDKLEVLTEALNVLLDNQPKEFSYLGKFIWNTTISKTAPVLHFSFYYIGTPEDAVPHLEPFLSLGPVYVSDASVPYPAVPKAAGSGTGTPLCNKGLSRIQSNTGIEVYNTTATRLAFEYFKDETINTEFQRASIIALEGYPLQGFKAIEADSTAYPHRSDNIIVLVVLGYAPNTTLDAHAIAVRNTAVQIFVDGTESKQKNVYVNYALGTGDESLEAIYGYEEWRLEKLRELKRRWDPEGRFSFFNPISIRGE